MKCILALVVFLLPLRAAACETEVNATPSSECVVMKRGEERGVWFRLDVADELRRFKLEVPELRNQVALLQRQAVLRTAQVEELKLALGLRVEVANELTKINAKLVEDARRAREEGSSWTRSPFLWLGVGSLATFGVGLGYKAVF